MTSAALLQTTRPLLLRLLDGVSEEDLLAIPEGFSNNILWNAGHIVVTQQLLHYGLSRLPLLVPDALLAQCRKGTSPRDWDTPPDADEVRRLAVELPRRLEEDLAEGRFTEFRPYTTSVGVELEDFETALDFNLFHEGLHTGTIIELRKALRRR